MHSTFCFLFSRNDFDSDLSLPELGRAVNENFEKDYVNHYCDDNNWYQEMALITWNCDCIPLDNAKDGDMFTDGSKKVPKKELFKTAMLFAMRCAAVDMTLYDTAGLSIISDKGGSKIDTLDRHALIEEICSWVPNRLALGYIDAIGQQPVGVSFGDAGRIAYDRRKMSRRFEHFITATIPPFGALDTAYNARCFDLRENTSVTEEDDELMVMFVDVHT